MAITTQLTLSIYTNVHAQRHTCTCASTNSRERSEKAVFQPFFIDPVTLTATPVVGPVKLDRKEERS